MDIETRWREGELRATGERTIEGYAAVYNSFSEDLGGFREVIMPGAFTSILASNPDVRALIGHDTSQVIGRTQSGTLTLTNDETGLAFSIDLPNTMVARDLHTQVGRGDISGASFGFSLGFDDYDIRFEGEEIIREVFNISRLYEVSVVAFPAYADTVVSARHLEYMRSKKPVKEKYLDAYNLKITCALLEI